MKPFGKDVGAKQGGTDEWYTPREAVESEQMVRESRDVSDFV